MTGSSDRGGGGDGIRVSCGGVWLTAAAIPPT